MDFVYVTLFNEQSCAHGILPTISSILICIWSCSVLLCSRGSFFHFEKFKLKFFKMFHSSSQYNTGVTTWEALKDEWCYNVSS